MLSIIIFTVLGNGYLPNVSITCFMGYCNLDIADDFYGCNYLLTSNLCRLGVCVVPLAYEMKEGNLVVTFPPYNCIT